MYVPNRDGVTRLAPLPRRGRAVRPPTFTGSDTLGQAVTEQRALQATPVLDPPLTGVADERGPLRAMWASSGAAA
eukprot:scaffold418_cov386-Prasinococcus_capsulatus_cf.AAC.32